MAAAARSALRSATTSARSATARLSSSVNPRAAPFPFRISSQKSFSTRIFRSPVEMSSVSKGPFAVNQRKVACFSSSSKRFQRIQRKKIDLKRNTSSMGIVEGVEYDANRTSRIALVRWEGGAHQRKSNTIEEIPPPERLESTTTTTVRGPFAFSSLPGKVNQSKKTAKDVFFSAFSSPKAKGESSAFAFPRIAVAGAKPAFFVFGTREKEIEGKNTNTNTFPLCEIQKWKPDSVLWEHRMKRKAALSWHSFRRQESLGVAIASEHKESKQKMDQGFYTKANRAPVSYILASHQLRSGMMVMNWSKPPTANKY